MSAPAPTRCHHCGHVAAAIVCPICKTRRRDFATLKNQLSVAAPVLSGVEGPPAQQSLPLGDRLDDEPSLRIAYSRVPELARNGITYERAIQIDSIRRCLTNISDASLRARANHG